MAVGRQQFDRVTVIRAQSGKQIVKVEVLDSTNVAPGTFKQIFVLAPPGKVARVLGGYALVPLIAGATGSHLLQIQPNISGMAWITGVSDAKENISWERGVMNVFGAAAKTYPDTAAAQTVMLSQMYYDSAIGLMMHYKNDGNTAQAGERVLRLQVLYEDVI